MPVASPLTRRRSAASRTRRTIAVTVLAAAATLLAAPADAAGHHQPRRPVIVIDPGHSPAIHRIDPATQLDVSDYANEPEMRDVFRVAKIVARRLRHDGYRVVLTKHSVHERVSLARRAHIANHVHAALALSIHDQAGRHGGIGFHRGNNIVYYQSVGTYRTNIHGHKIRFTNHHLARISRRYGRIFRRARARTQHDHVRLQRSVGYNLGSRGLAPGNIWIVQLLSKVPWIYNEAGGNSAGRIGLDAHDKREYARGLVTAVERCVPPPR